MRKEMKEDRIHETIAKIKTVGDQHRWSDVDKCIEDLPGILYEMVQYGGAKHCDERELQNALRLVTDHRITSNRNVEFDICDFINVMMEYKSDKEDQKAIVKALLKIRTSDIAKHHLVNECNARFFNGILLPCLKEICEYRGDCRSAIDWYPVILETELPWERKAEIYNRLAYYYLWNHELYNTGYGNHIDRARVYFQALERHGMPLLNSYSGTFGKSNHADIVNAVLAGTYKENAISFLTDYAYPIIESICSSGMKGKVDYYDDGCDFWDAEIYDKECDDIRNVMRGIYNALSEGCSKAETETWKDFLSDCLALVEGALDEQACVSNCDETIRFMLHLLYDRDNWLIHCAEQDALKGKYTSKAESLKAWTSKVKQVAGKYESVIMDSLYNSLIRELASEGQQLDGKSELSKVLEEKVFTVDCPASLAKMGVENAFNYYNKVYHTDDSMALMMIFLDNGEMDKFEEMVSEINSIEENVQRALMYDYDLTNDRLRKKYNMLLKLAGKRKVTTPVTNESSDAVIQGTVEDIEELYMTGKYEEALKKCDDLYESIPETMEDVKEDIYMREKLLKYICYGDGSDSNDNKQVHSIKHLSDTPCGTFTASISFDEWKKFYASFDEMAARYNSNPAHAPQYYCLSYCFEPKCETSDYNEYLLNHKPNERWCDW